MLFSHLCCLPLRNCIDTNLWLFKIYLYLYFFLLNLIIIINLSNLWVQSDPTDPCGLGWTYVMGWVEFFFDPPWWVGSKNSLNPTQPDPCTPLVMIYMDQLIICYTLAFRKRRWLKKKSKMLEWIEKYLIIFTHLSV